VSLPPLTLVPAGAGSGKTYTIQHKLGDWVTAGLVNPERIVAVTFTEAAAAELRERIRTRLLALGRTEDALRLDEAYISTIHAFGLRLLTELAFEAAMSPGPRHLSQDEEDALIRLALARTERADELTSDLAAFGYKYDGRSGKSGEDLLRADVLGAMQQLRLVGRTGPDPALVDDAKAWIAARYGATGDGEKLTRALHRAVGALLKAFPENLAGEHGTSKTGREALHRDFANLSRARDLAHLRRDWSLWQKLRTLRRSVRGAPLPDEYDRRAQAVMEAAGALPRHPGPLAHAHRHVDALLGAAGELLAHHEAAKREAGLIDFTDMVVLAHRLLEAAPAALAVLRERVDCVVIDEFQDTNPVQFALLWKLAGAGVPALVVGDVKQSIMGFQGADPRLMEALHAQHPECADPLAANWRSQPALMAFVNAASAGLFGARYTRLAPQAPASALAPLETVVYPTRPKGEQRAVRAAFTGRRVRALLADPDQRTRDRHTGVERRLRGGDVAVLCPYNSDVDRYAELLRALGLRVRVQAAGWHGSRAVQLVLHALAHVADPGDRHAALYLAVTELGSLTLEAGLERLAAGETIADPVLARLAPVTEMPADATVDALVAATIAALGLHDAVARWPDAAQARANLLRLDAEAREFEAANREALASGGYFGSGLATFLAWLAAKVESAEDGDRQPDARVVDEDAVEVLTWHRAKGREWPVVVVCGLDRAVKGGVPNRDIGYADFDDLGRILERARIECAPRFAAPESNAAFEAPLDAAERENARRLLYVALTRAREKLVLERPEYARGGKQPTRLDQLVDGAGVARADDALVVGGERFACVVTQGGVELPEEVAGPSAGAASPLPAVGRRAIRPGAAPAPGTPDGVTPSSLVEAGIGAGIGARRPASAGGITVARIGPGLAPEVDLEGAALGTFLHRCFEVLGARPEAAARLPEVTGVPVAASDADAIAAAARAFEDWLREAAAPLRVSRELPFVAARADGAVVTGVADVVAESSSGVWILDHKSDADGDAAAVLQRYRPQLEAYAAAIAPALGVAAGSIRIGVHLARRGTVAHAAATAPEAGCG